MSINVTMPAKELTSESPINAAKSDTVLRWPNSMEAALDRAETLVQLLMNLSENESKLAISILGAIDAGGFANTHGALSEFAHGLGTDQHTVEIAVNYLNKLGFLLGRKSEGVPHYALSRDGKEALERIERQ